MSVDFVIGIFKYCLINIGFVVLPILLTGLLVGLVVGAIQAATQLNEPTLTFVPKIIVVLSVSAMLMPWGLERFTSVFKYVVENIEVVAREP